MDFLKKLPAKPKMNLYDVLKVNYEPGIELAVDLLENLLVFNPVKKNIFRIDFFRVKDFQRNNA